MYWLNLVSSRVCETLAKLMLKWTKPVVIVKFLNPNVVLLANPETGVTVRKAHISQLKLYRIQGVSSFCFEKCVCATRILCGL
jgi:hypothetical protein